MTGRPDHTASPDAPLTAAPTLRTDRLTLRGPVRGDLAAHTAFVTSSPRLAEMGDTGDASEAWYGILTGIGHWHWHGYGFFVLTRADDPAPLGRVGLLNHPAWQDMELAWHLYDGAEGHGYASEAAIAVRDWAIETLRPARLVSYIDTGNTRSQAVARRLGAAPDGTRALHNADCDVWEHPLT